MKFTLFKPLYVAAQCLIAGVISIMLSKLLIPGKQGLLIGLGVASVFWILGAAALSQGNKRN